MPNSETPSQTHWKKAVLGTLGGDGGTDIAPGDHQTALPSALSTSTLLAKPLLFFLSKG